MSRYQKGKTSLDFTEARDSEWQWHQLGYMQVCTSLQTDNHASTSPLSFLQAGCPSCRPTNSVKALKEPDTNHKCPINGIFHCRCGYYYHSSIFKAKKPFPHRPQREGASTHYKYRAKNSTNGVGIKTPLQEVYIYIYTHTHPLTALVRDYPGEPVPER